MLHRVVEELELPDIEGVEPLLLQVTDDVRGAGSHDWVQETVHLMAARGLLGDQDPTVIAPLLLPLVETPLAAGCLARLVFITGPLTSWVAYELALWPSSGDLGDLLPAVIGAPVDEHLGIDTDVIEGPGRAVHERFHLVTDEEDIDHPGERQVRLVGGLAARLVDERLPGDFDVALLTSTTDLATVMASLPSLVAYLAGDGVIEMITS